MGTDYSEFPANMQSADECRIILIIHLFAACHIIGCRHSKSGPNCVLQVETCIMKREPAKSCWM